ncbi:ECERIFERUM 26-like [Olea europaea subsp. europaea]|uniref:ECERIFERUM 26-like n=1 Tax=Olea europaea subsp. europaea TaxID=158383 RepID=A0A8S0TRA4_OLEEU|nr:ECERIFERUM 26-like [Olea europaea subsp. europaea]
MVSSMAGGLIYDIKLSSVGPGNVTEPDMVHEPSDMNLAMKLHYLKGIYYFGKQAFEGLTTLNMKEPLFILLDQYADICGRFRRTESGRPYIKCNDSGVRFTEARCEKTMDEWLDMTKENASLEKYLTPNQIIGPELAFSPTFLLQYTKFKCGGMSVGLSWAHVLGDVFSAAEFLNLLGQVVAGNKPNRPVKLGQMKSKSTNSESPLKVMEGPLSIKRVGPVGDNWITANNCKMEEFAFNVNATQLSHLQSKLLSNGTNFSPFEALSAVIWQCIAKIRGESDTKVVTICKKSEQNMADGNNQLISVVNADYPIVEAKPSELAALIKNAAFDEGEKIENAIKKDNGVSDFIFYGANLTFVNLEEAKFYEFDYRGEKPVHVSYRVNDVGDEGAVLVLPGPPKNGGRTLMAIMPEKEVIEFKLELKREWFMD